MSFSPEHVEAVTRLIDQLVTNELIRIRVELRKSYGQFVQEKRRGFARGPGPTEVRDAAWRARDAARRRDRHLKDENERRAREVERWMRGGNPAEA